MALTEEQKKKALLEYERKQKHVASSKKSGTTEPKMSKEEAKKSVQETNEKVKQNAAKEKELMAGRTDPNLYVAEKKETKPTINSAEVLSSSYVPPKQATQQKIANSAVDRILNPTAYSQPADSTSSAPSFINPHQARSDSIARRAGVKQETLDNIQANNNYGKDIFTESTQAGMANYLSNAVGSAEIMSSLTPAGMISNAIHGRENNFWNQLNAPLQKWQEEKEADRQQAVIDNGNKGAEFYSQAVTTATQMVPDILITIASAGTNKALTAVDKAGDAIKGIGKLKNAKSLFSAKKLLPALEKSALSTLENPSFWNSFGQTLYPEYEGALQDGATENEALLTAVLSAFAQSKIEAGIGLQKLPSEFSPTLRRAVFNYVKSAVEEGGEEIVQGVVSGITQKLIFDHDKKLISSTSGEDAVFNMADAWGEFAMGSFMSLIMGAPGAMMSVGNAIQQPTAPVTPNAPTDVNEQPPASPVPPTPPVTEPAPVAEPAPTVEASPEVPNVAPEATQTTPEQKVSNLQKNKERLEKNIASLEGRTDPDALKLKSNWQALIARIDSEIANVTGEKPQAEPAPTNEADNVSDPTITDEPLSDDEIQAAVDKFEKEKAKSAQNVQPTPEPQVEPAPEPQVEPKVKQKPAPKPKPAQKPAVEHDEKVEQLIPKEENIPSTPEPNQLVPEMANDESRADYRKRMEKEWKKSEHGEGETFKAWFDEHWKQLKDEGKVSKVGKKEYLKADTGAQTKEVGAQLQIVKDGNISLTEDEIKILGEKRVKKLNQLFADTSLSDFEKHNILSKEIEKFYGKAQYSDKKGVYLRLATEYSSRDIDTEIAKNKETPAEEPPKAEEPKVEQPKVEEKKQPVVEETKPKEQPKKEEPKPKATQADVLLQNMDALGSDVFDNQENIEQKSEAKTEKKKQLSVKEILNTGLTETQIKRYSDRIDAINAYLENGENSLSAEQKKNFEKVLDMVDSPTPENLIQKRNKWLKELYGDNPPAELMKEFATETKSKEQPAQPESVSQEEVDNAKKLLKELDYSNADISKMQPSEIVALAKSLESEAPDTAVGAHKAGENPVAHAASEYGTYDVPEDVYNDYYRYLDKEKVNAIDRNVLRGKTEYNDDIKSYYEAVPEMVLDKVEFSEKDGKYYAGDKEIPKAVYKFGKYLEENGVQYWNNKGEWIPVQMDEEHLVSRFLRNIASSKYGSDTNLDLLENALKNGTFTYQQRHNKADLKNAESYIQKHGIEESLKELHRFTNGEIPLKPDQITEKLALGFTLVDMAYEIGDYVSAEEIMADLAPWATGSGQAVQFFSVIQRRGKPGEPILGVRKATAESYIKRFIKGLNIRFEKKLHGKQISLTPEDFEAWTNAIGTDKETEVAEKMFKKIANQIPASWLERFNAFRMFCMLCGPTTHSKNVTSNVAMSGAASVKDFYLARFEAIYKKKHPDYVRTATVFKNKEDKKFAKKTYEEANFSYGNKGNLYSDEARGIEQYRRNTFSGADYKILKKPRQKFGKLIDLAVNGVSDALAYEDKIFKQSIYSRKFAEIMKANGWTEEYFENGSPQSLKDYEFTKKYAIDEAYKITFNNKSKAQESLSKWRQMPETNMVERMQKAAVGAFIELTFPFKKVATNIPARAIDYSPLGAFVGVVELCADAKKENFDPHIGLERIASSAAGATIGAAGFLGSLFGVIALTGGDKDEDALKENRGWKNYSLKIGDYYLGLDDIAPATTMLMAGAKAGEGFKEIIAMAKNGEEAKDILFSGLQSLFELSVFGIDGILQLDFFSTITDFMSSNSTDESNMDIFRGVAEDSLESLAGQTQPNIWRKFMRVIEDDYANAYYYDKNDATPRWLQNIRSGAMALVPDDKIEQLVYNASGKKVNIPGYTDLAVRYDKWGRSINPEEFVVKAANNLISPFQISKDRTTPVDTELERLYDTTKNSVIVPKAPAKEFSVNNKKIYMTAKEYSDYSRELGKARYNNLEKLFSSKYYKELDDEEKVLAIEEAYSVADDIAKDKLFEKPKDFYTDKPLPRAGDYNEAVKDGLSPAAYIVSSAIYNDTQKTKTKSKEDLFYNYLIADKTTSAKDDALIMEHVVEKDFSKHYLVTSSPQEVLDIYEAEKQEGGKDTDIAYLADKFDGNDLKAFALYSGVNGTKKYENGKFSNFGAKQLPKAETLVNKKGWSGEDVAKAARCVTGLSDYLGKSRKTKANYITVLVEAGFTKEEANEFYNYYGW